MAERDDATAPTPTPAKKGGSAFGPTGVPSSADIGAALRGMQAGNDLAFDEATVAHFCDQIRRAAADLAELDLTTKGHDRAESYRYLLSMVMYIIDAAVLGNEPSEPMFCAPYQLHRVDWGAASPDAVYRRTWIRDDLSYRVYGTLGNADVFLLEFRRASPPVHFNRENIGAGPDGAFELFLGGPERESNWFPIPAGSVGLSVREFFGDWLGAQRSHLRIDCLDGWMAPRPEESARRVAAEFDLSADWIVDGAIGFWARQSERTRASHPNEFVPELSRVETKLPVATHGWWDLAHDEALIIELVDPEAPFWAFQLASSLWHTLDYANRLTSFNRTQTHRDDDGTYRLVLSHGDPGVHNWLDTTGLRCGVPILRQYRSAKPQIPATRLVKLADVATLLAGTRFVTPDQRRAQIAERREGVARLVCD